MERARLRSKEKQQEESSKKVRFKAHGSTPDRWIIHQCLLIQVRIWDE